MKLILIIFLFVVVSGCRAIRADSDVKVVGGSPTLADSLLAKQTVAIFSNDGTQLCTGSLIADKVVLTAAHCKVRVGASVKLGPDLTDSTAERVAVVKVSTHPCFEDKGEAFDLAVIELADAVVGGQSVKLPDGRQSAGDAVIAAGFGQTGLNASLSQKLMQVEQVIADVGGYSPQMLVVTAQDRSLDQTLCHGDSGGPSFRREEPTVQVGVTQGSSGEACHDTAKLVEVWSHREWITRTMVGEAVSGISCETQYDRARYPAPFQDELRGDGKCRLPRGYDLERLQVVVPNVLETGEILHVSAPTSVSAIRVCSGANGCDNDDALQIVQEFDERKGRRCYAVSPQLAEGKHDLSIVGVKAGSEAITESVTFMQIEGRGTPECHLYEDGTPDEIYPNYHDDESSSDEATGTVFAPLPGARRVFFSAGKRFVELSICKVTEGACDPTLQSDVRVSTFEAAGGRRCFKFDPREATSQQEFRAAGLREDGTWSRMIRFVIRP